MNDGKRCAHIIPGGWTAWMNGFSLATAFEGEFPDNTSSYACKSMLRSCVAAMTMQIDGKPLQLTVSIGVAPLGREDLRTAMRAADIALYRAKGLGRNQVCDAPEPPLAPTTALRPA
jgi:GGDEF domain-containing protein